MFCAKNPFATVCIEKKNLVITFNRTPVARFIKREVDQEVCSRRPDNCKVLQKKTNALFTSGLKVPVKEITDVAMHNLAGTDRGAEIVVKFSADFTKKIGGREKLHLGGFPPRPLERVVKELTSRIF